MLDVLLWCLGMVGCGCCCLCLLFCFMGEFVCLYYMCFGVEILSRLRLLWKICFVVLLSYRWVWCMFLIGLLFSGIMW